MEHGHNKYTRPADVRWITIEDLEPDRQYQFWVTAVTSAGEVGFIYGIAWLGLWSINFVKIRMVFVEKVARFKNNLDIF